MIPNFLARFLGLNIKGIPKKPVSWQKQLIGIFALLVILALAPGYIYKVYKILPPPFGPNDGYVDTRSAITPPDDLILDEILTAN